MLTLLLVMVAAMIALILLGKPIADYLTAMVGL